MKSSDPARIRQSGIIKAAIGFLGTVLLIALVMFLSSRGFQFRNPFYLIPLGVPFAYFCIGVIEAITAAPYDQAAKAWMSLKRWQRGVWGIFIASVAIVVIVAVVALLAVLRIL